MKGQTQAVTAVMITGVMVLGVASAYVWGVPLVEKRQSQSQLDSLESSVIGLEQSMLSVARSGQGSSDTVTLDLGNGGVEVNSSGNYLELTTFAEGAQYPVGSWRLIHGSNRQGLSVGSGDYGIQGVNTPGVVAVRRDSSGNPVVRYRVEFRNLKASTPSGAELRQIDLQSIGASKANGEVEIHFTNEGRQVDRGDDGYLLPGGERIDRVRNVVSVDLR